MVLRDGWLATRGTTDRSVACEVDIEGAANDVETFAAVLEVEDSPRNISRRTIH